MTNGEGRRYEPRAQRLHSAYLTLAPNIGLDLDDTIIRTQVGTPVFRGVEGLEFPRTLHA